MALGPYADRRHRADVQRRLQALADQITEVNDRLGAPPQRNRLQDVDGYVWCDFHGEVHGRKRNYYDTDGDEACNHFNWRRLYMEPDYEPKWVQS